MKSARLRRNPWAWLLVLALPASTTAAEIPMAAKLSAALGGTLDGGMITSDLPGNGSFQPNVPVNLGRGAAYRRQVASLANHSHLPTSAH